MIDSDLAKGDTREKEKWMNARCETINGLTGQIV
jgi:hypothetical protein